MWVQTDAQCKINNERKLNKPKCILHLNDETECVWAWAWTWVRVLHVLQPRFVDCVPFEISIWTRDLFSISLPSSLNSYSNPSNDFYSGFWWPLVNTNEWNERKTWTTSQPWDTILFLCIRFDGECDAFCMTRHAENICVTHVSIRTKRNNNTKMLPKVWQRRRHRLRTPNKPSIYVAWFHEKRNVINVVKGSRYDG